MKKLERDGWLDRIAKAAPRVADADLELLKQRIASLEQQQQQRKSRVKMKKLERDGWDGSANRE